MENDFVVVKDGSTLNIELGMELSTLNAPVLTEELSKYQGQEIKKVLIDATALAYLSSSGIRVIYYIYQRIGNQPEIIFYNCPQEIYDLLESINLTSYIKFEENNEMRINYRRKLSQLDNAGIEQHVKQRTETLDNYEAHNDVVCYTMKLGQDDE